MSKNAMKTVALVTVGVALAGVLMNQLRDVPGIREARSGFTGQ